MRNFKLRDSLLLLVGQANIAEYVYEGGARTPAISFGNPPNNIEVEGALEIICPAYPRITCNYHTSNLFHQDQEWDVYFCLHQLDAAGYEIFYRAVDVMFYSWERISGNMMHQNDRIKSLPMYMFTIKTTQCGKTRNPFNLDSQRANFGNT